MQGSTIARGVPWKALLLLVLAPAATAQSLVRISGLEGREIPGGVFPLAFDVSGDRVLCSGRDGLFAGDTNGFDDLTWFDTRTGAHVLAFFAPGGAQPDGSAAYGVVSQNGRFLACTTSATNLVPGDTNGIYDVYVLDQATGLVTRASLGDAENEPLFDCFGRGVSDDGRFVLFECDDDALAPGDANQSPDIFVRDLVLGTTELVSVTPWGTSGDNGCFGGALSPDGRYALFGGGASDLVAGDTNNVNDVFLRDRVAGVTTRLSVGPGGIESNADSGDFAMTPDARWVVFSSGATNLLPGVGPAGAVYLLDRSTGQLENVSVATGGAAADAYCSGPAISDDGRFVAFHSRAANLDARDTDAGWGDAFLRDRALGTTRLVSIATNGDQGSMPSSGYPMLGMVAIAKDGSRLLFNSNQPGLVAGDTNDDSDAFLFDPSSTCPAITAYCTAKTNSQGCLPGISSSGEPHLGGVNDAFFVTASKLVGGQPGLFLWGGVPGAAPFCGGTLCLAPPLRRTPGQSSGAAGPGPCAGTYSFHFSQALMAHWQLPAGQTIYGQYWGRDSGFPAPNNVALTGGLRFEIWP